MDRAKLALSVIAVCWALMGSTCSSEQRSAVGTAHMPSSKDEASGQSSQNQGSPAPQTVQLKFDEKSAWAHLRKQCDMGPRFPGSAAHKVCRDWIFEETKKYCKNVRLQPFSHKWSYSNQKVEMWNIIGEQNWDNAKVRVVLLAHWDTRPYADQDPEAEHAAKPIVGANDGASGVAVLLELMRVTKDLHPDLGILYLFTDGEDLGPGLDEMFLGAKAFAQNYGTHKPDYGILLDMIGDKDLRIPIEPNSLSYARPLVQSFFALAQKNGLGSVFPSVQGPMIEDDHIPLNRAGIPTMDLIDFDYPAWHTRFDTPDQCSPQSLGKVGKMMQIWLSQDPVWAYPKR